MSHKLPLDVALLQLSPPDRHGYCTLGTSVDTALAAAQSARYICGGQTHSIVKFGLDELLPAGLTLVHGPGCPMCVTPVELIDKAIEIALLPNVIFCSFGDMLRVPGTSSDLLETRASGGDVRVVYSPLDALVIASSNPDKEVVFFGVGFETTAPATAMAVYRARQSSLANFSLLVSHVLVPARDGSHSRFTAKLRSGFSCRRTCLHGDGLRRV